MKRRIRYCPGEITFTMRGDIESISDYVILQMARRDLALAESARKVMIGRAIKAWREQGLRVMREVIEWELDLLPAFRRTSDRIVFVCEPGQMRNRPEAEKYLVGMKIALRADKGGYWVRLPKSYDVTAVRKRLSTIIGRKV